MQNLQIDKSDIDQGTDDCIHLTSTDPWPEIGEMVLSLCGIMTPFLGPYKTFAEPYICEACKTSDTHKVQLPYAFKLMMQELMAINILPRIRVEQNEFTNSI